MTILKFWKLGSETHSQTEVERRKGMDVAPSPCREVPGLGMRPRPQAPPVPSGTVTVTPASQLLGGSCFLKWKIMQNDLH